MFPPRSAIGADGRQSFSARPVMKSTRRLVLFVLGLVLAVAPSSQAQDTRQLTATFLPVKIQAPKTSPRELLWIRQSTDSAVDPGKDVFVQFDLNGLPPGLAEKDVTRATLRLVAQDPMYQPAGDQDTGGPLVIVKGQVAKHDFSGIEGTQTIVSLSTLTDQSRVARQASEDLRKTVYKQYAAADKRISLRLFTESHKSSALLYSDSLKGFGDSPSNIPRLVVEYSLPSPTLLESLSWSQRQRGPEHTGRSAWAPIQNPNGYTLTTIDLPRIDNQAGSVADYPLIYQGNIHVVYKVRDVNYLMALDSRGGELWRQPIGKGTVQRSPVISRDGRIYVVTEDQMAAYDLNGQGKTLVTQKLSGKASDYTDLTMGHDGSLFMAVREEDTNSIYGFTPDLKPFLKAGPFGKGRDKISTVTVSPDGQQIFAQVPGGAVRIEISDPSRVQTVALKSGGDDPYDYYHVPIAGPAGGVMVYADFTSGENRGHVWGSNKDGSIWSTAGSLIPQPVLGSNGIVFYIQDSALQGHPYDQLGSATINKSDNLNATSNLVMDGANNIYFWDNGQLLGYNPKGEALFKTSFTDPAGLEKQRPADPEPASGGTKAVRVSSGPEQFIRLMLGPDGTLWANNRNGSALYAFTPSYAQFNLTLTQKPQDQTIYRATGTLTVGKEPVPAGTRVLLQGRNGIAFPAGFSVDKGASVLCRTGF